MAVYYIDPEGGNPSGANGLSYANRGLSLAGFTITHGDEVRYPETPYASIGTGIWNSVEHPFIFTSQHRVAGGASVTVSNCNTTTWTWAFSGNHGLVAGDYFKYIGSNDARVRGLFKVASVVNSSTVTTSQPFPLTTITSTSGGYAVYANNLVVKLANPSNYVIPLLINGPYDRTWNSGNNGSTGGYYNGDTQTQYGYVKNGSGSLFVNINNTTGTTTWYNLPTAVNTNGLTTLNWWTNPMGNGYARYWTTNGYNGYGSGQLSIRLYNQQNLGGQYLEYFFPWAGNLSQRWIPCVANAFNPSGVNLNTFQVQSISIWSNSAVGTQQFLISGMYLSAPRFAAEGTTWQTNTSSLNTNATNSSVNLHTLIGNSVYAPGGSSALWWPIDGITEHGDIVIGNATNWCSTTQNQTAIYSSYTRGYYSPAYNTSTQVTENVTTYVQQMLRRDPYWYSANEINNRALYNVTVSGGWTRASNMTTQNSSGWSFIDGFLGAADFGYSSNTTNINWTYSKLGISRFQHGWYIVGLSYQTLFDECHFVGCGTRAIYADNYNIYTSTASGQTNPYTSTPGYISATREYVLKFNNLKVVANGQYNLGNSFLLGQTKSGQRKVYEFSGNFNYVLSGTGDGMAVAYSDIYAYNNCNLHVKNNKENGINIYYCNVLEWNGKIHATNNYASDIVAFGVDTTYINQLEAGYRSWNNSGGAGTNINSSYSYFQRDPVIWGLCPTVRINEFVVDTRYNVSAIRSYGSTVGITTSYWVMSGIDYDFQREGPDQLAGPYSSVSSEYWQQNGTRKESWIWKQPFGWIEKNTASAYTYNNTGTSWKFTPISANLIGSPGRYQIGQVAVDGQSPITIACKYYNTTTANGLSLVVKRNNCGINTDLSVAAGTTLNSWQDLSLNFYPTKPGVLDVYINWWNNNAPSSYVGQSFYIDAFSFT